MLREVLAAAGAPVVVHCCAPDPPVLLLRRAGARGVSVDLPLTAAVRRRSTTSSARCSKPARRCSPAWSRPYGPGLSDPAASVDPVRRLWRGSGCPPDALGCGSPVVVTPTCGLAGADPRQVPALLRHCRAAARALVDDPEG